MSAEAKDAVEASIKDRLFDGDSARWRWPERIEGQDFYCGFVNAKNSYGAYTGFKPFMVMLVQGTKGWFSAFVGVGDTENAEIAVRDQCAARGFPLVIIPPE